MLNYETNKAILIAQIYDQNDASNYDYVGDYHKTLETAELVPLSNDGSDLTSSNMRPEFKEAMDSYEEFFDNI